MPLPPAGARCAACCIAHLYNSGRGKQGGKKATYIHIDSPARQATTAGGHWESNCCDQTKNTTQYACFAVLNRMLQELSPRMPLLPNAMLIDPEHQHHQSSI